MIYHPEMQRMLTQSRMEEIQRQCMPSKKERIWVRVLDYIYKPRKTTTEPSAGKDLRDPHKF
jgi:hypothetical protein